MFLFVLEFASLTLAVLIITTQVIIPVLQGRRVFPFFRRRERILIELNTIEEEAEVVRLEREAQARRDRLEREKEKLKKGPRENVT